MYTILKYNANPKSKPLNVRSTYQKTPKVREIQRKCSHGLYAYNCITSWNKSPHLYAYINAVLQWPLHTPHSSRLAPLLFLQTITANRESQVRLMAKVPVDCLENARSNKGFQRLPVLLELWKRTHGGALYYRCLIPSQLCRRKELHFGVSKPMKCDKLNGTLS